MTINEVHSCKKQCDCAWNFVKIYILVQRKSMFSVIQTQVKNGTDI